MKGGDEFEVAEINKLIAVHGTAAVHYAGVDQKSGKINPLSFYDFLTVLDSGSTAQFYAQIDLNFENGFDPFISETFLQRYKLNPTEVQLTRALPDLIEIIPSDETGAPRKLRIWDFKASRKARHDHYIQVAFYSLLLEHILRCLNRTDIVVDVEMAVIQSRQKADIFELTPYRTAVANFLRDTVGSLLTTPAADAHFHFCENCLLCEYAETCRAESDAGNDISRVPYMSSESKRRLKKAGIPTHRELAALHADLPRIADLRLESHDLSSNLNRYIKAAQTLEDGKIRSLETKNLLMPQYEDVRIILSAEQDAVSGTCFALGMKVYEGWDEVTSKVIGSENVFISDGPDKEGALLLSFLQTLNNVLLRVDTANKAVKDTVLPEDQQVADAEKAFADAEKELADFKDVYPRLYKRKPEDVPLIAHRERLNERIAVCKTRIVEAKREASSQRWKLSKKLHIYVYDGLELLILKDCLERHLLSDEPTGLLDEVRRLIRIFPPASVLPNPDAFRTVPGTVVSQVLKQSLTLPIAYGFDLASVSRDLQPVKADGELNGFEYRPKYGFGWPYSNQVAFERILNVWKVEEWDDMDASALRTAIEKTILNKLRATDSVVRAVKQTLSSNLLLKKEPFCLYETFDPSIPIVDVDAQRVLEVMEVFTVLEESFSELAVKHAHTMPISERVAKFQSINGLRYIKTEDGLFHFTFDLECKDAKIDVGNFNLVLTSESNPDQLIIEVDGSLFRSAGWRGARNKVTLIELDSQSTPPLLKLQTNNIAYWEAIFTENPSDTYVLDTMYTDYNSKRVLNAIQHLKLEPGAEHVRELVADGAIRNWLPFINDPEQVESELIALADSTRLQLLNAAQWRAISGSMQEPVSLIWGPPGTGKTFTVAHMLLCYAIAAKLQQRPTRILVTAFTHHAIVNVLNKTIELASRYGIGSDVLAVLKVQASGDNTADDEIADQSKISDEGVADQIQSETPCVIIGSTVWGIYKAIKEQGIPQHWFDVVLIDEASQMKLSDALLALAASKPTVSLVLAGDDKQLPPILHGTYVEEHKLILSSVFVFIRHKFEQALIVQGMTSPHRALFQLEENFRMNEPLTAYPRQIIYGNYTSTKPAIQIGFDFTNVPETVDPFLSLLMDPSKPVILVRYTPERSYTAKNPIEATLIAQAVYYLSGTLTVDGSDKLYSPAKFAEKGVAVLAPHRAQNAAMRNVLGQMGFGSTVKPMPLVDTVEKLQGKERAVVFVSYGVADGEYAEAEATFLLSENRFNVAATRAERKLIVFCADPVIDVVPTDRQILLDATMLKEFKNYCADGQETHIVAVSDIGDVSFTVHWKSF
ncbi:bifunctional RecB family nuclease/DEAD/DEAH box helicase [Fibrella aquatilis]|uniref:AAA family ATPase n=1 Tax=Fibrella aquatilis TaxID=2817059 RepID=A0A939K0J5_9BACT|nr:AAA domain-containing protein [Fibrella aquatilis]MBO0932543.1 AAA family ATPase [Fibrella aquatilis]